MSTSPPHGELEPRPELQCRYRGRRCLRPRGWTVSNRRHSLCDHHRMLANQTQQRWQRRRLERLRTTTTLASGVSLTQEVELLDRTAAIRISNEEALTPIDFSGTYELTEPTEEDLRILREILGVEEETRSSDEEK